MTSRGMRTFLFLILVYFSQVAPFYHIHHFHQDGLLEFEISSHPSQIDVEHSSEHHHDQDLPHTNDHPHTFDNQITWSIVRTQSQKAVSFDDLYSFSDTSIIIDDGLIFAYRGFQQPLKIDSYKISTLIIRGPPHLT